jgi:hypothetical protein
MAENNSDKTGDNQGGMDKDASGDSGITNKEVLTALGGIQDQLKNNQDAAGKLSAEDNALLKELLAQDGTYVTEQPEPEDIELDDPKVKKALARQEKQFQKEMAILKEEMKASDDANLQATVDIEVEKEIQQAYAKYGDDLKTNWDKVQAVVDKVPGLTVSEAMALVLEPEQTKKLSEIAAKERAANEKKAGAGVGTGINIAALNEGIEAETQAEAAEKLLDKIMADGGQL